MSVCLRSLNGLLRFANTLLTCHSKLYANRVYLNGVPQGDNWDHFHFMFLKNTGKVITACCLNG